MIDIDMLPVNQLIKCQKLLGDPSHRQLDV